MVCLFFPQREIKISLADREVFFRSARVRCCFAHGLIAETHAYTCCGVSDLPVDPASCIITRRRGYVLFVLFIFHRDRSSPANTT